MGIEVETKDCTALSDGELSEMADISVGGPAGYDIGLLSKAREEWVLITQARDNGKLVGFGFCTLERIGGPNPVLVAIVSAAAAAAAAVAGLAQALVVAVIYARLASKGT